MFADLVVDLLIAEVGLDRHACFAQRFGDFAAVIIGIRGDRGDHDLQRGEPQRHVTGKVLDENAEETLHRTADGAMDHDRLRLFRVLVDIEGPKAFRQVEVHLRRAALPFPANGVLQRIFELRPVECALARQDAGLNAAFGLFLDGFQNVLITLSARSQRSSDPTRFSGRVESLTTTSLKPKSS